MNKNLASQVCSNIVFITYPLILIHTNARDTTKTENNPLTRNNPRVECGVSPTIDNTKKNNQHFNTSLLQRYNLEKKFFNS